MVSRYLITIFTPLLTFSDEDDDDEVEDEVDDEDVIYQPEFDDGKCLLEFFRPMP